MTSLLDYNNQIRKLYKVTGTNYGDGIRSGNFRFIQGTRTVAPGVDTTDLQFYSPGVTSNPAENEPILTYTVASGSAGTYYIPLTNLLNRKSFDLFDDRLATVGVVSYLRDQFGVISPFKYSRNYCERIIQLSCDVDFTFNISGYTMYDQKIVYNGPAQAGTGDFFSSGSPIAAISSISFFATPPFTMNLYILVGMGLPYTDWGNRQNTILIGSSGAENNYMPYKFVSADGNNLLSNSMIYYNSPTTISRINPFPRPYFIDDLPIFDVWHGGTQMFSIQNINPGIFDPNDPNGNPTYSSSNYNSVDLSDVKTLRGPTPYSDGWVDWQG